jgi:hypothetical protein
MSSPGSPNLEDIEEDLAESEDGETVDVNASDYQRSMSISWPRKQDNRIRLILIRRHTVDDHPNGYPRLAALLNSDENFLICRKYGFLHSRVLLYRQDELRELEQQLVALDKASLKSDDTMLKCRMRDERMSGERSQLIQNIDDKLKEYNDIVQRTRSFATLQRATERNYQSVYNWIFHSAPLSQDEASTFNKDRDFVAIVDAKEGSWFDGRVENALTAIDKASSKMGRTFTRVCIPFP